MSLTVVDQGLLGTYAQYTGFKNRIINGDMRIDQRNAGASITITTGSNVYSLDRWQVNKDTAGITLTAQQSSVAPAGFKNSLLFTASVGGSPTALQYLSFQQKIEGLNASDLEFGTANASAVTLSFWVRSSIAGTYAIALRNSANDRSYVATYTINTANTFEQKTITIAGDTTGTWLSTSGIGIRVGFDLGSGSGYNTTAGAWQAGEFLRTSGTVNWGSTSGATFYITGVQLEAGSTATSFDRRDYGRELIMCQRYFYTVKYGPDYAASGVSTSWSGGDRIFPNKGCDFKVQMRAAPTATFYSGQTRTLNKVSGYSSGTEYTISSVSNGPDTKSLFFYLQLASASTVGEQQAFYYDASAEL